MSSVLSKRDDMLPFPSPSLFAPSQTLLDMLFPPLYYRRSAVPPSILQKICSYPLCTSEDLLFPLYTTEDLLFPLCTTEDLLFPPLYFRRSAVPPSVLLKVYCSPLCT